MYLGQFLRDEIKVGTYIRHEFDHLLKRACLASLIQDASYLRCQHEFCTVYTSRGVLCKTRLILSRKHGPIVSRETWKIILRLCTT